MVASVLPPLSCSSVFGPCGQAQAMRTTSLWVAFVVAHTSGFLLVAGVRPHCVDPLSSTSHDDEVSSVGEIDDDNPTDKIEPTCEELRAMWRYTKRQIRATHVENDLPFIQDPYAYKKWNSFPRERIAERPRTRAAGGNSPVYGRVVLKAPTGRRLRTDKPLREKAFEDVVYLYGTVNFSPPSPRRRITSFRIGGGGSPPMSQVPQSGSFQHLRDLIRAERARELQEQYAADEVAAAKASNVREMSTVNRYKNMQRPQKHFMNSLEVHEYPRKTKYDVSQAWSRGGHYSQDYMLR